MTMRPGGNTPRHFKSFFRKPGLAQAVDNDRWGRRLCQKKSYSELRKETTRLRQGRFRVRTLECPPACPAWGWDQTVGVQSRRTLLVRCVRADCRGRLFTAKLGIVVHYLPHQLLDHLLADDPILLACQFSNRLGDRVGGQPTVRCYFEVSKAPGRYHRVRCHHVPRLNA